MPKVSVLMPAYNAEKYIAEAIESILNQSFTDFEFIIIDDASSDGTCDVIQDYIKKDSRIHTEQNIKNLWIATNRNKLLSLATGKYIVWQDADDISMDYRIEKQYNFMEAHPEVWICGWGLQFFDETGNTSQRLYAQTDEEVRKTIFRYSPVSLPASIMRKENVQKVEGFDEWLDVAEDLNLSFKLGIYYKFANLSEILIKYRENSQSATFKRLREMELKTLQIRWKNNWNWWYRMSVIDKIYNFLQYISIYLIPWKIKIQIFNFIRNQK